MKRRKRVILKSIVLNVIAPLLLIAGGAERLIALQGERADSRGAAPAASWFWRALDPSAARRQQTRSLSGRMEGYFPNIVLYTQENQPVRFYDDLIKGKVVLINFMYTNGDELQDRSRESTGFPSAAVSTSGPWPFPMRPSISSSAS
jgi:hypothetical protein